MLYCHLSSMYYVTASQLSVYTILSTTTLEIKWLSCWFDALP